MSKARRRSPQWHQENIRALRRHLGLTQQQLAQELGIRQQTVSEWETGLYAPRGASARLLSLVAERAGFAYSAVLSDLSDSVSESPPALSEVEGSKGAVPPPDEAAATPTRSLDKIHGNV